MTLRIDMAPVTRSQAHQQEHGKLPEQMQDPLSQVGPDIMLMHVFGILEPVQLARCILVCKDWQSLAKLDPLWGNTARSVWLISALLCLQSKCKVIALHSHCHCHVPPCSHLHAETLGGQVPGPSLC